MGCPIAPNVAGVSYYQYLGLFDALGQLKTCGETSRVSGSPLGTAQIPWLPPAMAAGRDERAAGI